MEQVQNVLSMRGRPRKTKEKRKAIPFLGLMQCGDCGCAITAERQKGHNYHRCTKKKGNCTQKRYIREEALTEQIRQSILQVSLSGDLAVNTVGGQSNPRPSCGVPKSVEFDFRKSQICKKSQCGRASSARLELGLRRTISDPDRLCKVPVPASKGWKPGR